MKGAVQCSGVAVCEEADQGVESGVKGHNGWQVEGAISGDSRIIGKVSNLVDFYV